MFGKTRIRNRLLAVGLGLAALTAPTTALAGGYSGQALKALNAKSQAENNRYGGKDGYSFQALQAINAKGESMNQRYGSQSSQLNPSNPETRARLVAQGYEDGSLYRQSSSTLLDGRSPDTKDAAVAAQQSNSTIVDGRSPDTKDAAIVVHEPFVTITKTPSFQWGDFGIGTGVALAAMLMLALSLRFLSNRRDRKPGSVATA